MEPTQPDRPRKRPEVPAGTRVYAVGDIHGRADLLERLERKVADDAAGADTPERRVLVYLGDYVDRGPESYQVLERLAAGGPNGFETVCLRGNHEAFFLDFLDGTGVGRFWLSNGGKATLQSYGVDPFALYFDAADPAETAAALRDALPPEHEAFLRGLGTVHREGDYLFVHAGIRPGVPLTEQDPFDLIWIRHEFLESDDDHGCVVVHGHSPASVPQVRTNRIGIDTGAYATGHLTCLVLEGTKRRFLTTR